MAEVPEKPSLDGLEEKWSAQWDADGTYRFDRATTRDQIYAIDTQPPTPDPKSQVAISRRNFVDLCETLTAEDEQAFEHLWRTLGLSVDWSMTYTTIDERSRRIAQRAFLRNVARGEAYASDAPTLW